jgi:hypothetical protein
LVSLGVRIARETIESGNAMDSPLAGHLERCVIERGTSLKVRPRYEKTLKIVLIRN